LLVVLLYRKGKLWFLLSRVFVSDPVRRRFRFVVDGVVFDDRVGVV
jgi:hypothetical protein